MGGGTGGYTTASKDIVDVLRHKGRPYVFSNSVTPSVAGATLEVFKMLDEEGSVLIQRLRENSRYFRTILTNAGFEIMGHEDSPIAPIWLGDTTLTRTF